MLSPILKAIPGLHRIAASHFKTTSKFPRESMKKETHKDDEKEEDRLSDLPDCLLLRILSILNAKHAVQTCILSKRWKHLWKHLSTLRLHSSYFNTPDGFNQFASRILSLRDHSTTLRFLKFHSDGMTEPPLPESILKQAVSCNIQQLQISFSYNIEHIQSCIFSCQTLTSLQLYVLPTMLDYHRATIFPNSLNLPALTILSLRYFMFRSNDGRAEPFSALKKLNSLTIRFCRVFDKQILCISSATLTNLTIQTNYKHSNYSKIKLSTPTLSTFAFAGTPFPKLCGSHLCYVKRVNIDAYMRSNNAEPPSNLLSWLIGLTEIKSLTVSSTTLQVLSLVPNLLKVKFHSLRNLKSLRVKMEGVSSELSKKRINGKFLQLDVISQKEVAKFREEIFKEGSLSIPDGIVGFLLQNSPLAEVHIIN